jgi:hypothetical protein
MKTDEIIKALDAMEYAEQFNPDFDLKAHRKIRQGLANYERDRKRYATIRKWALFVAAALIFAAWIVS